MVKNYLIVDKRILPAYYEKVIKARELLESTQVKEVSEAVKIVGISRSTYYKYKDFVFALDEKKERKAVLSLVLTHEKGILSQVLNLLYHYNASIITINQNIPINQQAAVLLSIDISEMDFPIPNIISALSQMQGVESVKLIAIE